MRIPKHKRPTHRKNNGRRFVFARWAPQEPEAPTRVAARPDEAPTEYRPLTAVALGGMQQRTKKLPKVPPRTALPPEVRAGLDATARRVAERASGQYRIPTDVALFRGGMTWNEFDVAREHARQEQMRRLQNLAGPWSDPAGVHLGTGQSPKTLVFSTNGFVEFEDVAR